MHIIYIEDNPNDRRFVERVLESVNYTITTGETLDEVKDAIVEADLIMIDIVLGAVPEGILYPERLSKMGVDAPCIAVTARVTPNEVKAYLMNGFSHVLTKPFTAGQLVTVTRTFA
ncbi:MAG: response regulator [Chloroflexota bacterium]